MRKRNVLVHIKFLLSSPIYLWYHQDYNGSSLLFAIWLNIQSWFANKEMIESSAQNHQWVNYDFKFPSLRLSQRWDLEFYSVLFCLTTAPLEKNQPWFVVFVNFHAVNTLSMADFKLATWCDTITSCHLVLSNSRTLLRSIQAQDLSPAFFWFLFMIML